MKVLSTSRDKAVNPSRSPAFCESPAFRELARAIESQARPVSLPPNCVLFREGDPPKNLYLLKSGEVAFTLRACDRTVPCFTVSGVSLIGLSGIIAHIPFALTATASPGAEILRMESDAFVRLVESQTEWYMCVLRALADETVRAHYALAEMLEAIS